MSTDCFKFGSISGCREDCPVLQKCECEIYLSPEDFIAKVTHCDNCEYLKYIRCLGDDCMHPNAPQKNRGKERLAENREGLRPKWCPLGYIGKPVERQLEINPYSPTTVYRSF